MTIIARRMKMITSNVLVKFTGKRLYSGLTNLVNIKKEEGSTRSNLGLDFCVRTCNSSRGDVSHWHVIDRNTKGFVPPLPLGPDPEKDVYSAASYGSKVYITGGYESVCREASNEVFCMDTHHPEKGWKELSPMKHERSFHGSIFFGDKMYVWGLLSKPEVYDKNLNKWDSLDRLPKEVALHAVESTCNPGYNLLDLNYEVINTSIYSMAFVGGIVYGLCRSTPGDLLAYDPSNPNELKPAANSSELYEYLPQWDADDPEFLGVPEHFLISLGDDILGVVWLDYNGDEELLPYLDKVGMVAARNLRCSKFRMKQHRKSNGELEFVADPIDRFSCIIRGTDISNCIAVEPLLPRDDVVPEEVKMKNRKRDIVKTKKGDRVISEQAKMNGKRENVEMKKRNRVYPQEEVPISVSLGDEEKIKASQILEKLLENRKVKKEEMWEAIVEAATLIKPEKCKSDKGEEEAQGLSSKGTNKKATAK